MGEDVETIYDVYWEDAGTLASLREVEHEHVIYQLIGQHLVYGHRALLYIGKTEQAQPIARLRSHHALWGRFEPDHIHARVASIRAFLSWEEWRTNAKRPHARPDDSNVIAAVEELLIYVHQPAYNSQSLREAPRRLAGTHLRIFNTGLFGPLLPEVSTRRYIDIVRPADDDEVTP